MMEPILADFTERVRATQLNEPRIPYVSNVTGDWVTAAEASDPNYWARHLRMPVRFAQGLNPLLADRSRIFLEVGPGHSLSAFVRRHPQNGGGRVVRSTLRHPQEPQPDTAFVLDSAARLWLAGVKLDWPRLHAEHQCRRVHLPCYPYEQQRYWAEGAQEDEDEGEAAEPVYREPDIADWFYLPSWRYALPPEQGEKATMPSVWLVFEDDQCIGGELAQRLRERGHTAITVKPASAFERIDPDSFAIDATRREDLRALLSDLTERGLLPDQVVHLSSLSAGRVPDVDLASFEHQQHLGLYSLLCLVQALVELRTNNPVQVTVVSNDVHLVTGDEEVRPSNATVLAFCKAVPQEYPHIACRSVDITFDEAETVDVRRLVDHLLNELAGESSDTVVAYRGGQRWVQVFDALRLEEPPQPVESLRPAGTYLITGGLGKIGLSLANALARRAAARLVLVARSEFPPKEQWPAWVEAHASTDDITHKIRQLEDMEAHGAEVMICRADVADLAQMKGVLDRVQARFGRINGVVHAAGNVSADGFFGIDEADPELCQRQFRSKVQGLLVLDRLLASHDLDFVVLLSSISSVLAGLGYVAYSAANIFMDAFAHRRNAEGAPWISIDWDTWEFEDGWDASADSTLLAMSPAEGVEAFLRIVASVVLPQVVVSTGYLDQRIEEWIHTRSSRQKQDKTDTRSTRLHPRPVMSNSYIAPRSSVERAIAEMWQATLGVAEVGIIDNFFTDLSGSSLLATQLVAQLRSRFEVDLPLRRFFEGPTIAELATIIESQDRGEPAVLVATG
jgi:acyl transferase domain-containing protein/acyl carrier protein